MNFSDRVCPHRSAKYIRFAVLLLQRALLIAAILLAGFPPRVQAQSGSIRFDTLSVENGLSQSTVHVILQDTQGLLWFGTDDGLNKYDGYNFTLYKHDAENPTSLAENIINTIFQDSHGELWIGTTAGLDHFNRQKETFDHYQNGADHPINLHGANVSSIVEVLNGDLWVGTTDGGLNWFDRAHSNFIHYPHRPGDANTPASDEIRALLYDKGILWIGTSAGLDSYDIQARKFTHYLYNAHVSNSLSSNRVLALFKDHNGNLWIGTEDGGLNRMNPDSGTFTRFQNRSNNPYTLSSNYVQAISEDKEGHLWVGGRDGLNLYQPESDNFTRYQHDPNDPQSLSNDYILSIYVDRSGVLWVGTYGGGLNKYVQNSERFALYQHQSGVLNSLNSDMVNSIFEDHEGVAWVGTMDGGLNRLDKETQSFSAYQSDPNNPTSLSNNDVRSILEDRYGTLWVGTYGGLNRFDRTAKWFTHYLHDTGLPSTLSDNRVTALYEDRRGNLWVGTRAGGLELMNRDKIHFTHFRHSTTDPNSICGDYVRTIYEDHTGSLWIGTDSGVCVMDPVTMQFQTYRSDPNNPNSLSDNRVISILETTTGTETGTEEQIIWIGTLLGGLNRFIPARSAFKRYTQKQGLPSNTVDGILADQNGYLWISTNRGLTRFDPRSEGFRNYDRRDGLQSYEFNPGAYFKNNLGRMYFGGIQGFNAFDPTQLQDNPLPPPIVITAFKKFNQTEQKDLVGNEKITLSYQENFISFEFAALDYSASEKNQYAYKLEGFDKEWVFAGTRRYASYTNLAGGKYTFRVIGSNQDGIWNDTGASVDITITPPLWESPWFIGGVILLLLGLSVIGYRLRMMDIQVQNRNLEEQVRERTQEIERRREIAEGLREILTILNSNHSLNESLDAIIQQVVRLMDARVAVIFRFEEDDLPAVVSTNLRPNFSSVREQPLPPMPTWLTEPILHRRVYSVPDLFVQRQSDPELAGSFFGHYAALLAVPMIVDDKVDGGLALLYSWAREFSEEDIQMAASFADHAALAIANALLRSQAEEIAVSAERSRLARDLHDAVTQTLFATSLIAEVLPKLWERNPEVGRQKVDEIRELTRGALAEMRTLLMELRPTALMDVPLPDLLKQLSEAFTGRARVPVTLDVTADISLPSNVKIGFYRIVQEALNNIQKHSRATQVKIKIQDQGDTIELSICDNGVGFDTGRKLPDHFGLGIMEERAQSVSAQYSLASQPGQGTQITVSWKK
jgi:signal transduction histidine kinase/ligand-binding sensor domain-containing protein